MVSDNCDHDTALVTTTDADGTERTVCPICDDVRVGTVGDEITDAEEDG